MGRAPFVVKREKEEPSLKMSSIPIPISVPRAPRAMMGGGGGEGARIYSSFRTAFVFEYAIYLLYRYPDTHVCSCSCRILFTLNTWDNHETMQMLNWSYCSQ